MALYDTNFDTSPIDRDLARLAQSHNGLTAPRSLYASTLKRGFDFVFALMIAPIVATLVAALWAIIRLEGKPAIYAHERVGKDGKLFKCYKLRTMRLDADRILAELCANDPKIAAEWDEFQKLENDPRVTPIGRFLRATSLDELPQLWNVLTGEMSFVGPRPYTADQADLYVLAGGRSYETLRPGITGLWQIKGRNATTFSARARFDNTYADSLGFARDVALMLQTVGTVFNRTGR